VSSACRLSLLSPHPATPPPPPLPHSLTRHVHPPPLLGSRGLPRPGQVELHHRDRQSVLTRPLGRRQVHRARVLLHQQVAHALTHSLTHSCNFQLASSLDASLTYSLNATCTQLLIHSTRYLLHSLTQVTQLTPSLTHSLTRYSFPVTHCPLTVSLTLLSLSHSLTLL
jgi:hypothetical protein